MSLAWFALKWAGNQVGSPRVIHRERDKEPGTDIWLVGPFVDLDACSDWASAKQEADGDDPRWQAVAIEVNSLVLGASKDHHFYLMPVIAPGDPNA